MSFGLIFIFFVIIGLVIVLKFFISKSSSEGNRPSKELLPSAISPNDKLIIVTDIEVAEMERIISDICDSYNEVEYRVLPRLVQFSPKQFAIIFPHDISFQYFCFFVNYASYPIGFDEPFEVIAWASTKKGELWVTAELENKRVMLFISEDDKEHDNVHLTTADNEGFVIGFSSKNESLPTNRPLRDYLPPIYEYGELNHKNFKDFT